MTDAWPRSGQRVALRLLGPADVELTAIVDDVQPPDQLHLREPVGPETPAPLGDDVLLTWTSPLGLHRLRARLAALPESRVVLWRLQPEQAPEVDQRREYVRVPDVLSVRVTRDGEQWSARLCDLSEGGTRCVLLESNDVTVGDRLEVELELEGQRLQLPAVVLAVDTSPTQGRTATRLRFEHLRREADLLRRRVLELQRRARASGLR